MSAGIKTIYKWSLWHSFPFELAGNSSLADSISMLQFETNTVGHFNGVAPLADTCIS